MMSDGAVFVPVKGLDVIDHCHAHIEALIEEARRSAQGGDKALFTGKLAEFRSYVVSHFAQEEVMMRGTNFPAAAELIGIHQDLLRRIDGLIAASAGDLDRAPSLVRSLAELLHNHEINDDCRFHDYYERLGGHSVEWTSELATGVEWIDQDHQALFGQLDVLERRMQGGFDPQEVRDTLERFVITARQHFGREEQELMRQGQGGEREHHEAHLALLRDLGDILDAYDRHASALLAVDYLKYWVVDHVRRVDLKDFGPTRA